MDSRQVPRGDALILPVVVDSSAAEGQKYWRWFSRGRPRGPGRPHSGPVNRSSVGFDQPPHGLSVPAKAVRDELRLGVCQRRL